MSGICIASNKAVFLQILAFVTLTFSFVHYNISIIVILELCKNNQNESVCHL